MNETRFDNPKTLHESLLQTVKWKAKCSTKSPLSLSPLHPTSKIVARRISSHVIKGIQSKP